MGMLTLNLCWNQREADDNGRTEEDWWKEEMEAAGLRRRKHDSMFHICNLRSLTGNETPADPLQETPLPSIT